MLVGIFSDSHGRVKAVRLALELLDSLGARHFIHCGDIGGAEVIDEFVGRQISFVWGNMDAPEGPLLEYIRTLGLQAPADPPVRIHLDGKSIAVFHGHEPGFDSAIRNLQVDYLCHGHTHVARDERLNGKRIINPGALYRANRKTVATLDTDSDELAFHEIKGI